VQPDILAYA